MKVLSRRRAGWGNITAMASVRMFPNRVFKYTCPWCGTTGSTSVKAQGAGHGKFMDILVECPSPDCGRGAMLGLHPATLTSMVPAEGSDITLPGGIHPVPQVRVDEEGLPTKVVADFKEALGCEASRFFLGAAVVGRRVLQWALIDKGAKKGSKLHEQINNCSLLAQSIKDHAHEVRFIGNDAAHPDPADPDEPVTAEAVRDLLVFTDIVLDHLYRFPARLDAAKKRRT